MKKTIFVLLLILLVMATPILANAEDIIKKEDSEVISDDIKMNLGALEAYQEKDGEPAFKEAENVKSVFRIYNTSLHIAFSKHSNITSLLESEDILQTIYVVQYKDGTFRAFNDDNSYTELLSNRFVYDDTGEKIVLPPVDISEQALAALQTNDIVSKAAKDMKVLHKYYLYGEPSMSGSAVYYETDKGDYVYYYHYSIGEYLFPVAEFCAFQKAIVAEINKNPNADGGVVLSGIWDLSKYDFNSSTFNLNAAPIKASDSIKINKTILWSCVVLAVCLLTVGVAICIVRQRKRQNI